MTPNSVVFEERAHAVRGDRDVIAHRPATIEREFSANAHGAGEGPKSR